jgi:hypothetical protein
LPDQQRIECKPGRAPAARFPRTIIQSDERDCRQGIAIDNLGCGNQPEALFVEVAEQYRPSWQQIQELALEQVRSSSSVWAGDARAVAACARCAALKLNRTSRESWNWTR